MQYFGGKARIAKPLAEFLNSQLKEGQSFVDLFCGSCNVISKIDSKRIRIANDLHYELIEMWKYASQHTPFSPDRVDEVMYKRMRKDKNNEEFPAWLRGFAGFGCAFGGDWFKGFAKDNAPNGGQDYFKCAVNSTNKKLSGLTCVEFTNKSYQDVVLPENSMIYCDIPYSNSVGYSVGKFNHEEFYKWAVQKQLEGHTVLVSEYKDNVPEGWEIVWELSSRKSIRDSEGVQKETVEVLMKPKEK